MIYTDLPLYGTPTRLAWKKHRTHCINSSCVQTSWVIEDHRIAAKNCLLLRQVLVRAGRLYDADSATRQFECRYA